MTITSSAQPISGSPMREATVPATGKSHDRQPSSDAQSVRRLRIASPVLIASSGQIIRQLVVQARTASQRYNVNGNNANDCICVAVNEVSANLAALSNGMVFSLPHRRNIKVTRSAISKRCQDAQRLRAGLHTGDKLSGGWGKRHVVFSLVGALFIGPLVLVVNEVFHEIANAA